jgi:hypothetical protein
MMREKKLLVVNITLLVFGIILIRWLAIEITHYFLRPNIGNSYSHISKVYVADDEGSLYEDVEYNQVKVYKCTNDSVFYLLTMYNGVNCNDTGSATIEEFAKLYK